jgi:hypothetical protein
MSIGYRFHGGMRGKQATGEVRFSLLYNRGDREAVHEVSGYRRGLGDDHDGRLDDNRMQNKEGQLAPPPEMTLENKEMQLIAL